MTDEWPRMGNNTDYAILELYRTMSPRARRVKRRELIIMYRLHKNHNKGTAGQYSRRIKLINKVEKEVFDNSK